MFGIGFNELVIIAIVAVVVVGPKRLPMALRAVGRAIGEFRRAMSELRKEVQFEEVMDEVSRPLREGIADAHRGIGLLKHEVLSGSVIDQDMEYPVSGPDDYGALPEHVTAYAVDPLSPEALGDARDPYDHADNAGVASGAAEHNADGTLATTPRVSSRG